MDQIEAHSPASRTIEEKDKATEDLTFGNIDDVRTVNKSVVSSLDVDLTDDVWLLVFSYLGTADRIHGRVARVCRRWRKLNEISWKSVTTLSLQHDIVFNDLRHSQLIDGDVLAVRRHALQVCLQQCGTRLKRLDLFSKWNFNFEFHLLDLMIHHSASLQELNLSYSRFNNLQLNIIAQRIPRLRSISLRRCEEISEDGLRDAFTVGLQSLKSLNVAYTDITGEFFSLAPQSLTEVMVTDCLRLTDRGVRLLAEKCPNLETTDIFNDYCNFSAQSIAAYLCKNCPKLKILENVLFLHRGWDLPTLQSLYSLPLLEELHLLDYFSLVTDQFVGELSRHCPRINTISFLRCSVLSDNALNHISTWVHLESICLEGDNQITDDGLIHFESACPKLKKVDLSLCKQITHVGVGHFVSAHPNLRALDISNCPSVTQQLFSILESSLQDRQRNHQLKIYAGPELSQPLGSD